MDKEEIIAVLIFSIGCFMGSFIGFWQGCQYPAYKEWKANRYKSKDM